MVEHIATNFEVEEGMLDKLTWLGHASFKITGEKTIYIDPWKIESGDKADIILVSHPHYDHYSQEDIDKILAPHTVVVTVEDVASKVGGIVKVVAPRDTVEIHGITIEAVPAYNVDKEFHPKSNAWLGFVVEMGGERLYYAGDTDRIPEMGAVSDVDIALLPVGGTYTMDAWDAVKVAEAMRPRIAIPYHWGDIVGSSNDAERFAEVYSGRTEVLSPE